LSQRQRTLHWSDPQATAAAAAGLSGLDFLRAMLAGEVPPASIQQTMNFFLHEVDEGRVVMRGRAGEELCNPLGQVHGGFYGAILDSAMGCAIHATLPLKWSYTTLEYRVNMVRAIRPDTGDVFAEGKVLHRGRQIATADGRLIDRDGRLYAHGLTTCLLFSPKEHR